MTHDWRHPVRPVHAPRAPARRASRATRGLDAAVRLRHLAEYVPRHAARGASPRARASATARRTIIAAWVAPPRAPPPFYDVAARAESAFATVVSPCPAKGLALLRALGAVAACAVRRRVHGRTTTQRGCFAAAGVTLLPAAPFDDYRRTKVLLVPSVWPEAYGLVATGPRCAHPRRLDRRRRRAEANPLGDPPTRRPRHDAASNTTVATLAAHEARLVARGTRERRPRRRRRRRRREPASSDDTDDDRRARIARDPNGRPSAPAAARRRSGAAPSTDGRSRLSPRLSRPVRGRLGRAREPRARAQPPRPSSPATATALRGCCATTSCVWPGTRRPAGRLPCFDRKAPMATASTVSFGLSNGHGAGSPIPRGFSDRPRVHGRWRRLPGILSAVPPASSSKESPKPRLAGSSPACLARRARSRSVTRG